MRSPGWSAVGVSSLFEFSGGWLVRRDMSYPYEKWVQDMADDSPIIGVGAEDCLAVVAALGDVMRYADRHHPRMEGHGLGL